MRILIVDDDPEIRLLAGLLLGQAGHAVLEAADPAEARAAIAAEPVDVLLMDVMLGEDDGVSLALELLAAAPAARLVFLTGATRQDQLARMAATPASGVVHKPFDPQRFAAALDGMLETDG